MWSNSPFFEQLLLFDDCESGCCWRSCPEFLLFNFWCGGDDDGLLVAFSLGRSSFNSPLWQYGSIASFDLDSPLYPSRSICSCFMNEQDPFDPAILFAPERWPALLLSHENPHTDVDIRKFNHSSIFREAAKIQIKGTYIWIHTRNVKKIQRRLSSNNSLLILNIFEYTYTPLK